MKPGVEKWVVAVGVILCLCLIVGCAFWTVDRLLYRLLDNMELTGTDWEYNRFCVEMCVEMPEVWIRSKDQ